MKVKEAHIRSMIRKALITERLDAIMGRLRSSQPDRECEHYTTLPRKLRKIFQSASTAELVAAISKQYPSISKDLALTGIGDPDNKTDGAFDILFGYFNSYLYATGFGCLQYYYLSLALDSLALLLGVDITTKSTKNNASKPLVDFKKGIIEKASMMAKSSTGFVNDLAFYALPNLAKKGPEFDDVTLLKKDLNAYQEKIDNIRNIRTGSIQDCFDEIIVILDINRLGYIKKISKTIGNEEDSDEVLKMKKDSIRSLIEVMADSRLNYNDVISKKGYFSDEFADFFRRNS